jgi:transcriptional regulator with XRE-family HTH domain
MHDAEIEAQVQKLTQILDEAAHRTRRSRRSLERELGLAHGYLGNLFRGRTELKVYHLLLLAKLLHLDPNDLLRQALQEEGGAPAVAAEDGPALPTENEVDGLEEKEEDEEGRELVLGLGLERIRDLIRQTFRDEVRKLGGDLAKLATDEEKDGGKG